MKRRNGGSSSYQTNAPCATFADLLFSDFHLSKYLSRRTRRLVGSRRTCPDSRACHVRCITRKCRLIMQLTGIWHRARASRLCLISFSASCSKRGCLTTSSTVVAIIYITVESWGLANREWSESKTSYVFLHMNIHISCIWSPGSPYGRSILVWLFMLYDFIINTFAKKLHIRLFCFKTHFKKNRLSPRQNNNLVRGFYKVVQGTVRHSLEIKRVEQKTKLIYYRWDSGMGLVWVVHTPVEMQPVGKLSGYSCLGIWLGLAISVS